MRIGFFDIEASNLNANFGLVLTACMKESGKAVTKFTKDTADTSDRKLVDSIIADMNTYDIIVTWYGKFFDVPFLRTRSLLKKGENYIDPRLRHIDLWDVCRKVLKFTSNRLDTVSTDMGFAEKTRISGEIWTMATQGDMKAMQYILHHNVKDVRVLEKVYNDFQNRQILKEIKSIPRI